MQRYDERRAGRVGNFEQNRSIIKIARVGIIVPREIGIIHWTFAILAVIFGS